MLTLEEMVKEASRIASLIMYEKGRLDAAIILHTKTKGTVVLPYKSLPPHMTSFEQSLIISIVRGCRMANDFAGLVMASEAWAAKAVPGDDRRPAEREDKEEKVIITAWDKDLNKTMRVFSIIRNDKKTLIGGVEQELSTFESWLEDSFK